MPSRAGRPRKGDPGVPLPLRLSTNLNRCLEQLADMGIDGTTRQEVARLMIIEGIHRRIRKNFLSMPPPFE